MILDNNKRVNSKIKHKLIEIIFIAVVATISNSNNWVEVETFAKNKLEWLKKIILLENRVPSHDTGETGAIHIVNAWVDES